MTEKPTAYDTGARLEPKPWRLSDDDHYGLVVLVLDERVTEFTLVGKKRDDGSPGYLLSISRYSDDSVVEIDGDKVLVLDEDTLSGLCTLVELAQHGREDFQYQAESTCDYNEEDVAAADDAWHLAQETVKKIQGA